MNKYCIQFKVPFSHRVRPQLFLVLPELTKSGGCALRHLKAVLEHEFGKRFLENWKSAIGPWGGVGWNVTEAGSYLKFWLVTRGKKST